MPGNVPSEHLRLVGPQAKVQFRLVDAQVGKDPPGLEVFLLVLLKQLRHFGQAPMLTGAHRGQSEGDFLMLQTASIYLQVLRR